MIRLLACNQSKNDTCLNRPFWVSALSPDNYGRLVFPLADSSHCLLPLRFGRSGKTSGRSKRLIQVIYRFYKVFKGYVKVLYRFFSCLICKIFCLLPFHFGRSGKTSGRSKILIQVIYRFYTGIYRVFFTGFIRFYTGFPLSDSSHYASVDPERRNFRSSAFPFPSKHIKNSWNQNNKSIYINSQRKTNFRPTFLVKHFLIILISVSPIVWRKIQEFSISVFCVITCKNSWNHNKWLSFYFEWPTI